MAEPEGQLLDRAAVAADVGADRTYLGRSVAVAPHALLLQPAAGQEAERLRLLVERLRRPQDDALVFVQTLPGRLGWLTWADAVDPADVQLTGAEELMTIRLRPICV